MSDMSIEPTSIIFHDCAANSNPNHDELGRFAPLARQENGVPTEGGNGTIRDRHGVEYRVIYEPSRRNYSISVPGKEHLLERGVTAGGAQLRYDGTSMSSVGIHGEFQRRGLASALYDHVEEHLGRPLRPNRATTDEGEAFWKARRGEVTNEFNPALHPKDERGRFTSGGLGESGPMPKRSFLRRALHSAVEAKHAFTEKLDRVTDVAVLRQIKAGLVKAKEFQGKLVGKLRERYGAAATYSIMASAQTIGTAAMTQGVVLPGSGLWGMIPGVAVAEGVLQASRLVRGAAKEAGRMREEGHPLFNAFDPEKHPKGADGKFLSYEALLDHISTGTNTKVPISYRKPDFSVQEAQELHGTGEDKDVPFSALHASQRLVVKAGVLRYLHGAPSKKLPLAVQDGETYVLVDGHHRATAEAVKGSGGIRAHVIQKSQLTTVRNNFPLFNANPNHDENGRFAARMSSDVLSSVVLMSQKDGLYMMNRMRRGTTTAKDEEHINNVDKAMTTHGEEFGSNRASDPDDHQPPLWRGVSGSFANTLKIGSEWTDPSFVSTSKNKDTAISYSSGSLSTSDKADTAGPGAVMLFRNVNGLDLAKHIPGYENRVDARFQEVMLPRNQTYRVTSDREIGGIRRLSVEVVDSHLSTNDGKLESHLRSNLNASSQLSKTLYASLARQFLRDLMEEWTEHLRSTGLFPHLSSRAAMNVNPRSQLYNHNPNHDEQGRFTLSPEKKKEIEDQVKTGVEVHRGTRESEFTKSRGYASDPGDFGRGEYHTTVKERAKQYGDVTTKVLKLNNPLVLSDHEAYELADKFQTVRLPDSEHDRLFKEYGRGGVRKAVQDQLMKNSQAMTDHLVGLGHDGLVSVRRGGEELEIVHFKPTVNDLTTNDPPKWSPPSSQEKLQGFQEWLKTQVNSLLVGKSQESLWRAYIEQGWRRGVGRTFDDVNRAKPQWTREEQDFYAGSRDQFLRSSFNQPAAREKVELLASRTFDEMENVTSDMGNRMSRVLADGMVRGASPHEVARDLTQVVDFSRQRAEVVARTELIRAHAEGQLTAMEQLGVDKVGVEVEWLATEDDRTCEICAAHEGNVLTIQEARGLIPFHPNAVFAGTSFVPYGECLELVRAYYSGPSVVLTATGRGVHRLAIGPNHPMMTKRGMVKAADLHEGDEVLYDLRQDNQVPDDPAVYRKQVPFIEDCFESILRVGNHSLIASSSSDLHGDRKFCEGEVKGVVPTRGLLFVRDPKLVKQLLEDQLIRSDARSMVMPDLSSFDLGFGGVYPPSRGTVGSSDLVGDLLLSHGGPLQRLGLGSSPHLDLVCLEHPQHWSSAHTETLGNVVWSLSSQVPDADLLLVDGLPPAGVCESSLAHLVWLRVAAVESSHYTGFAFDGTTESGLYCSDGFVVSNCRCAWVPNVDGT